MTLSPRLGRLAPGLILLLATCGRTELDSPVFEDAGLSGAAGSATGGFDGGQAGRGGAGGGGRGGGVAGGTTGGVGSGGAGGTTSGRGGTGGSIGGRGGTNAGGAGGRGGTNAGGAGMAGRGGTGGSVGGRGGTVGGGGGGGTMAGRGGAGGTIAGRGGTSGTTGTPIPIPCGGDACIPGIETCCSQGGSAMCIDVNTQCTGVSIGCLEGAGCPSGTFCCGSIIGSATSCVTPAICSFAGGFVLCTSNAQCPTTTPNCCRLGQTGICRAQSCQ